MNFDKRVTASFICCVVLRLSLPCNAFVPRIILPNNSLQPQLTSRISSELKSSVNGENENKSRPSLAELEDMEEERLRRIEDHRKTLNTSFSSQIKSSASSSGTDALNNGMFEEEDAQNAERQQKIQQILEEDDAKWREERRKKMLGKFANVRDEEEWKKLEEEEKRQVKAGMYVCMIRSSFIYTK